MNIKNSNILRSWNMERIEYQRRYSKLHKDSVKNPEDRYILGQIHELKYILVSFFGLTEDELKHCINSAYDSKFDTEEIAPLVEAEDLLLEILSIQTN